jgi:hypothetical protein
MMADAIRIRFSGYSVEVEAPDGRGVEFSGGRVLLVGMLPCVVQTTLETLFADLREIVDAGGNARVFESATGKLIFCAGTTPSAARRKGGSYGQQKAAPAASGTGAL